MTQTYGGVDFPDLPPWSGGGTYRLAAPSANTGNPLVDAAVRGAIGGAAIGVQPAPWWDAVQARNEAAAAEAADRAAAAAYLRGEGRPWSGGGTYQPAQPMPPELTQPAAAPRYEFPTYTEPPTEPRYQFPTTFAEPPAPPAYSGGGTYRPAPPSWADFQPVAETPTPPSLPPTGGGIAVPTPGVPMGLLNIAPPITAIGRGIYDTFVASPAARAAGGMARLPVAAALPAAAALLIPAAGRAASGMALPGYRSPLSTLDIATALPGQVLSTLGQKLTETGIPQAVGTFFEQPIPAAALSLVGGALTAVSQPFIRITERAAAGVYAAMPEAERELIGRIGATPWDQGKSELIRQWLFDPQWINTLHEDEWLNVRYGALRDAVVAQPGNKALLDRLLYRATPEEVAIYRREVAPLIQFGIGAFFDPLNAMGLVTGPLGEMYKIGKAQAWARPAIKVINGVARDVTDVETMATAGHAGTVAGRVVEKFVPSMKLTPRSQVESLAKETTDVVTRLNQAAQQIDMAPAEFLSRFARNPLDEQIVAATGGFSRSYPARRAALVLRKAFGEVTPELVSAGEQRVAAAAKRLAQMEATAAKTVAKADEIAKAELEAAARKAANGKPIIDQTELTAVRAEQRAVAAEKKAAEWATQPAKTPEQVAKATQDATNARRAAEIAREKATNAAARYAVPTAAPETPRLAAARAAAKEAQDGITKARKIVDDLQAAAPKMGDPGTDRLEKLIAKYTSAEKTVDEYGFLGDMQDMYEDAGVAFFGKAKKAIVDGKEVVTYALPTSFPIKVRDTLNGWASIAILGNNPGYAVRNLVSNIEHMIVDGMNPFHSMDWRRKLWTDWEVMPIAVGQGMGAANYARQGAKAQSFFREPTRYRDAFKGLDWDPRHAPTAQLSANWERGASQKIIEDQIAHFWPQVWPKTVARFREQLAAGGISNEWLDVWEASMNPAMNAKQIWARTEELLGGAPPAGPAAGLPSPVRPGTPPVAPAAMPAHVPTEIAQAAQMVDPGLAAHIEEVVMRAPTPAARAVGVEVAKQLNKHAGAIVGVVDGFHALAQVTADSIQSATDLVAHMGQRRALVAEAIRFDDVLMKALHDTGVTSLPRPYRRYLWQVADESRAINRRELDAALLNFDATLDRLGFSPEGIAHLAKGQRDYMAVQDARTALWRKYYADFDAGLQPNYDATVEQVRRLWDEFFPKSDLTQAQISADITAAFANLQADRVRIGRATGEPFTPAPAAQAAPPPSRPPTEPPAAAAAPEPVAPKPPAPAPTGAVPLPAEPPVNVAPPVPEGVSPRPLPPPGAGNTWARRTDAQKRFWAYAGELGLKRDDVHRILGVQHLSDFDGFEEDANRLLAAATRKEPLAVVSPVRPEVPSISAAEVVPAVPPVGTGRTTTAYGADPNRIYEFQYKVVPLDSLIPSHTDGLLPNPAFPTELQPRLRDRAASQMQVDKIVNEFVPGGMLDEFNSLDRGAMIVGPDNLVESGNGRTLALRKMREQMPEKWQAYQAALPQYAERYGIAAPDLAQIKDPVLVRERTTPVDRVAFVGEANLPPSMAMSPVEMALADASRMQPELLATLEVNPDQSIDQALLAPRNKPVVVAWVKSLPATEQAQVIDAAGNLSQGGLQRFKSALLTYTYGGPAGQRLAATFTESLDSGIKQIQTGVYASLPRMAQAESLIRSGLRPTGLSIADDAAISIDMLAHLRESGRSVASYLQPSLVEKELTLFQQDLLAHLDGISRSPRKVRELLDGYADEIINAENAQQLHLSKEVLYEQAKSAETAGEQVGLFGEALPDVGRVPQARPTFGAQGSQLAQPTFGQPLPKPAAAAAPAVEGGLFGAPVEAPRGGPVAPAAPEIGPRVAPEPAIAPVPLRADVLPAAAVEAPAAAIQDVKVKTGWTQKDYLRAGDKSMDDLENNVIPNSMGLERRGYIQNWFDRARKILGGNRTDRDVWVAKWERNRRKWADAIEEAAPVAPAAQAPAAERAPGTLLDQVKAALADESGAVSAGQAANFLLPFSRSEQTRAVTRGARPVLDALGDWLRGIEGKSLPTITAEQAALVRRVVRQDLLPALVKDKAIVAKIATDSRNFALGDYAKRRYLHEWLAFVAPWSYWYTFTWKNWAQRILMQPAFLSNYLRYKSALGQANLAWYQAHVDPNAKELPPGLSSAWIIDVPFRDAPIMVQFENMLNPLSALTNETIKTPALDAHPLGSLFKKLSSFGMSWSPILQIGLQKYLWETDAPDAARELGGYYTSISRLLKNVTAGVREAVPATGAVIPPGGYTPEMSIFPWSQGGDYWDQRRIPTALTDLLKSGQISQAEYEAAGFKHEGTAWDAAAQGAALKRLAPSLISFIGGPPFKPYDITDVEIEKMWTAYYAHKADLKAHKGVYTQDQIDEKWLAFETLYPWYPVYMLARETNPRDRLGSYTDLILRRLPPGTRGYALKEEAGLPPELVSKFYDARAAADYGLSKFTPRELATLQEDIEKLTGILGTITPEQKAEFNQAKAIARQLNQVAADAAGTTLDGWYAMQDAYYAEKDKSEKNGTLYLLAHPQLKIGWVAKDKAAATAGPLYQKYYGEQAGSAAGAKIGGVSTVGAVTPEMQQAADEDELFKANVKARFGPDVLDWWSKYSEGTAAQKLAIKSDKMLWARMTGYLDYRNEFAASHPVWARLVRGAIGSAGTTASTGAGSRSYGGGGYGGGGGGGRSYGSGGGYSGSTSSALTGLPAVSTAPAVPGASLRSLRLTEVNAALAFMREQNPQLDTLIGKLFGGGLLSALLAFLALSDTDRAKWLADPANAQLAAQLESFMAWFAGLQTQPAGTTGTIAGSIPGNTPTPPALPGFTPPASTVNVAPASVV